MSDLVFDVVVDRATPIDTFLIYADPMSKLILLGFYSKGINRGTTDDILLVLFVDLGMSTNS